MGDTDSDRRAFEALVRRHQAQVCAVAYARLRDRSRAEEVAQDAFLIAWRDRATVEPSVRWICGIARNLARNAARRRTEVPMPDDPATLARDARDELIDRENAMCAEAALGRLPEKYREAVVLYYGGDESIADVASALGISQDLARQRVHRGRERLRDQLASVETTLRAARPTAAFTAGVVAAWMVGQPTPAHAARLPRQWLAPTVGAVALVIGVVGAAIAVTARHHDVTAATGSARSAQVTDPRAMLRRRFPASSQPPRVALPAGAFALAPTSTSTPSTPPPPAPRLVELDFHNAPFVELMHLLRNELDTPIWVAYETDAHVDIQTHGKKPAIDVLDEVLASAGASREEVAALQIVPGGRTDASVFGGEVVTLSVQNVPLNFVLDALEPKLGMPIGRLGNEVLPGTVDEQGNPTVERSPPVSLDLHGVPVGAALEQALQQAGVGYELTTGFVILPR